MVCPEVKIPLNSRKRPGKLKKNIFKDSFKHAVTFKVEKIYFEILTFFDNFHDPGPVENVKIWAKFFSLEFFQIMTVQYL